MSLLRINGLEKSFGSQEILKSTSIDIDAGNHIGLVGRNGIGKTTMLRMIAKTEQPSGGHIVYTPGLRIGYLEQDPHYPKGRTLYQEVREGLAKVEELETELRGLEDKLADQILMEDEDAYQSVLDRYAHVQEIFESREGWNADARVEAILDGLKVPRNDWERDLSTFSGGERNIIGLARLLVQKPDLMLLDEPGNHLDFDGLDWLETVLRNSTSAYLIVSHNRYLLDSVCNSIWEMEDLKVEPYSGNYSAYRAEKLIRIEKAEAQIKRQERETARLKFQIQRLKSWASVYDNPKLARTAKRFEKRIENMEQVDVPKEFKKTIGIQFKTVDARGDIALDIKNYTRQFPGSPPLMEDVSFRIGQGEKVALVGANGTGKSTLFKDLVKEGRWEHEILRVGKSMKVGYFSQMGEYLEMSNNIIDEMMRLTGMLRNETEGLLYKFLFTRDDFVKKVAVLSGGEKARLQLAALMAKGCNLLLLDEPTNHLDIRSREAVEDALEVWTGTLFVISHDRYFLDKMVDRLYYLDPPQMLPFDGNFSDFFYTYKEAKEAAEQRKKDEQKAVKAEKKAARKPHKIKWDPQRFAFLEAEIERLEEEKEKVEAEMIKEREKGNSKREAAKKARFDDLEEKLEIIYEEWFALGDKKKNL